MSERSRLKIVMEEAKRDLVEDNELDSPMFYIISNHPGVPKVIEYLPALEDPHQSLEEMGIRLNEICDRVDAEEVISFVQIILRATDQYPARPCLVARLERKDKVFILYQPYIYYETENRFHFQKEIWKMIDKDDSAGSFEHQVIEY